MLTIHKYRIDAASETRIMMPSGAHILSCQIQHGNLEMWALVDTTCPMELRRFRVYGTGHEVNRTLVHEFVGTAQLDGGALVLHVFEVTTK